MPMALHYLGGVIDLLSPLADQLIIRIFFGKFKMIFKNNLVTKFYLL